MEERRGTAMGVDALLPPMSMDCRPLCSLSGVPGGRELHPRCSRHLQRRGCQRRGVVLMCILLSST